jgi:hypothetical protein
MIRVGDFTVAVCELLDALGLAAWVPVGPITGLERVCTVRELPTSPDDAVAIAVYEVPETVGETPEGEVMVQLRFRAGGARTAVDDFADDVATAINDRYRYPMGGYRVSRSRRVSFAHLGPDSNGRQERADNYAFLIAV